MFKEEDGLAGNNNEEYLRHFGFTVEDLSFLISPQSSLSPIKKKQRNVFNFEDFGDEIDTSAPVAAAPGAYPGNYPTVYQQTYDQASPYVKDEDHEALPSFEGLDLTSFEVGNPDEYLEPPPTYGSNHAHAGSGASSIASEHVDTGFSRMGSSMGMGSLNFSTMSSFGFDEADADELLAQTQPPLNQQQHQQHQQQQQQPASGRRPEGVADTANSTRSASLDINPVSSHLADNSNYPPYGRGQVPIPPLPPLPPVTTSMCIEDASFIINAQQQQLLHQKQLLDQQQRSMSGANSNKNSWNQQDFQRSGLNNGNDSAPTPPLSRIGSFKSTLPPLSVDMNALNAAHHAHQQAKLYQQTHGGGNSNNNSFLLNQSNLSSSGRSSGNSSPERGSYLSDSNSNPNGRPRRVTEKERERRTSFGNRSRDDAGLAAALLSLSNPASAAKDSKALEKEKEKEKAEDTRASKSLATISRRFVEHFGEANTFDYISGLLHVNDVHDGPPVTNRVDGAAEVLGVHVRRIYELIKILEILSLVTFTGDKRGKFGWRGTKDFLTTLGTIQADGITKYPDIAYAHGLRMPQQPLQSPSAACGSPLTVSQPGTPQYVEGQTSPFFGGSASGSGKRGMHPGFGAHHLRTGSGDGSISRSTSNGHGHGGHDRSAALALGGIGYESHSQDPYESMEGGSTDNAYLEHINALPSLDVDLSASMDNVDLLPNSPDMRGSDIDTSEIDAFAAHLLGGETVPMELASAAGVPKYNKKRTALKKSSKTPAASATGAGAGADNHEEFMVEGICKSFLQLFLVGMDGLTMNFAIQKLVPMEANQTLNEYNKVNATKIRRVYDVANVLCSLNLVNKITMTKKQIKSEVGTPDSNSHHTHTSHHSRDSPLKDSYRNLNTMNNTSTNSMNTSQHNISQYNNSNNNSSNNFDQGSVSKGARGEGGKGDSKILEWGSFPPTVIRDYYLNKMCI